MVGFWAPQIGQTRADLWDYGPHGLHGQLISGSTPTWEPGPFGWNVLVSSDGWVVPDNPLLGFGTENFSVFGCGRSDGDATGSCIFGKDSGNSTSPAGQETWAIQAQGAGDNMTMQMDGQVCDMVDDTVTDGVWHSYFGVRDGDECRSYLDSVLKETDATFFSGYSLNNDKNLSFCCRKGTRTTSPWIGGAGPWGIWTRALSALEIRQLHYDPLSPLRLRRRVHYGSVVAAASITSDMWDRGQSVPVVPRIEVVSYR